MQGSDSIFDVRVIERNLERGIISKKDYEDYLASLPDTSENAEFVSTEKETNE